MSPRNVLIESILLDENVHQLNISFNSWWNCPHFFNDFFILYMQKCDVKCCSANGKSAIFVCISLEWMCSPMRMHFILIAAHGTVTWRRCVARIYFEMRRCHCRQTSFRVSRLRCGFVFLSLFPICHILVWTSVSLANKMKIYLHIYWAVSNFPLSFILVRLHCLIIVIIIIMEWMYSSLLTCYT